MTNFMRGALACILAGCCGAPVVWAQSRGSVRLLDIQPTTGVTRVTSGFSPMAGARLTRFMEDGIEAPAAILAVTWEQSPGLAPAGVALHFDYRMDGESRIRTKIEPLPPRERGPKTVRFTVPLTPASGARVSAWRLRVMAGGQVLEEVASAAWN